MIEYEKIMAKLSKLNWGIIIGLLSLIATIIFGLPIYWSATKPDLLAQGNVSTWFIPKPISSQPSIRTQYIGASEPVTDINYLQNVRTYIAFTIINNGSYVAEDTRLNLTYDGIYSTDFGDTTSTFDRVINLGELRPKEPHYVWIWTNANEIGRVKEALINYKNGSVDVDFGIQAYGVWGMIFSFIGQYWFLIILLPTLIIALILGYISENKTKGNVISPSAKGIKIIEAKYGTNQNNIDVVSILNDEISKKGFLDIFVSNELFGDPHHGSQKQLEIKYIIGNKEYGGVYIEGVRLRIP